MPSSVAPTRLSQLFASLSLVVAGESRTRYHLRRSLRAKVSSARRRSRSGIWRPAFCRRRQPRRSKDDEERRRFRRELLHAALRRMDALQQRIERKRAADRDDDLAVENECRRLEARARPRPARENNVSAAGPISIAARPCRRRERRGSGSHPISARTAIPRPVGISSTERASIGGNGGRNARAMIDTARTRNGQARGNNANGRHFGRPLRGKICG